MLGILSIIIFLPVLMAVPTYLFGKFNPRLARIVCIGTTTTSFGLTMLLLVFYHYGSSAPAFQFVEAMPWAPSFGLNYIVGLDGISLPLLIISTFLSLLASAGSWDLINSREPEYYALFLIFGTGIIGVFTSLNLILFYVFWEIVLIPMFFFIGVWGGPRRRYAALKFLLFTYVASAVMLFGFLAIYAYSPPLTRTFDYISLDGSGTLITQVNQMPMFIQLFASITTFIGFAVKLPIVPFHTWLPDAHVEAPAPVSVLLAGLLLKMGGYGFIRYNLLLFSNAANTLWPYFAGIGLITMIYGATVALVQTDLKRMIAMTSINHMGFVLLGTYARNVAGVSGAVFQMFNHALAIGILFLMSGYIHEHMGTRNINELSGLRGRMPLTATLLVLGSLAAMAIPGLANFISEYLVIAGALTANPIFALAIIAPALTVGYFLWMLRRVVLTPSIGPRNELHLHSLIILAAFLVPLFILGAYPGPMLDSIIRPTILRFLGGGP